MNKVLTIVVPTYNMESLLAKNLESLAVKKNLHNALEVLVVNDGSKDCSSEIGHQFQNKYPQIFRVIDKPNGNYGSCVNVGLKEAEGKYIRIMDADDSYDTFGLEKELAALKNLDVDLLLTDYFKVNMRTGKSNRKSLSLTENKILTFDSIVENQSFLNVGMHQLTYKTDNLRKLNYKQTEGVSYTDQEWIFLPMTTVNTAYYLKNVVYRYLLGRDGQTCDSETYFKHMDQLEKILYSMIEHYRSLENGISIAHKKYLANKIELLIYYIYNNAIVITGNMNNKRLDTFDRKLLEKDKVFYKNVENRMVMKINHFRFIKAWRRKTLADSLVLKIIHYGFSVLKAIKDVG